MIMLSGPGGGGCKLSDDWDRDGAESLLDDGRVPLAACFLVRGILGGFWMGGRTDGRGKVQEASTNNGNVAWRLLAVGTFAFSDHKLQLLSPGSVSDSHRSRSVVPR